MSNALRLGDEVIVDPYWPRGGYPDTRWRARVKAFERFYGTELVLVEAVDRSGDPLVENELSFPFGALTLAGPEESNDG